MRAERLPAGLPWEEGRRQAENVTPDIGFPEHCRRALYLVMAWAW